MREVLFAVFFEEARFAVFFFDAFFTAFLAGCFAAALFFVLRFPAADFRVVAAREAFFTDFFFAPRAGFFVGADSAITAWAAARRAIGTRNGEQLT